MSESLMFTHLKNYILEIYRRKFPEHNMLAYIRKWFISGLLVWLPIIVTFLVIRFLVDILSKSLLLLPPQFQPDKLLGFHLPGIGVLLTILIIFFTGVAAANFLGRRFMETS